ncbi:universal stress protein [Desulfosporosinus sp. PR]|uniref:universal stress protein n=1 Tax=Candidatus Desulfosporosinus nitrosoreducens TaxID=3401928 RepID=UPI0027EDA2C1|nr:universal stress protein [Desulfosporosinus sp. PR]MDQ7092390.1 universal stress protein [Desulfosporosinus sp. PR]
MNNSKFKVLLYSDGSHQAFSAAVYTATLLKNIPNMDLTVLQIEESQEGFMGTEYSWIELRPKYKRYYWGTESTARWSDTYPSEPKVEWFKRLLSQESDSKDQYAQILAKTNQIFAENASNIKHQVLFSNVSKTDIADTADMILDYSRKNSFNLIIMGTQGLSALKGLIFGGLAHKVLNKSAIPVLLIKKLPQEFIDAYLSDAMLEIPYDIPQVVNGRSVNVLF